MIKSIPWNEQLSPQARRAMFLLMLANGNADDGNYRRKEAPAVEGWFLPGDLHSLEHDDFKKAGTYNKASATSRYKVSDTWQELDDVSAIEVKKLPCRDSRGRRLKKSIAFRLKRDVLGFHSVMHYLELYDELLIGYRHSRYYDAKEFVGRSIDSRGPSPYAKATEKFYKDWQEYDRLSFTMKNLPPAKKKYPFHLQYIDSALLAVMPGYHRIPPMTIEETWKQQKRIYNEVGRKPQSLKELRGQSRSYIREMKKKSLGERQEILQKMSQRMKELHKDGLLFQHDVDHYKMLHEELLGDEAK